MLLLSAIGVFAQSPSSAQTASNLEGVLNQMDAAAATFKNAEADFTWDLYHKVVDETDTQKGTIYFRRSSGGTQMAADITSPDQQTILFTGGKIQIYQPKIGTVNEYDASKNKSEVESFLVLGFGGRGHDLGREFQVTFAGNEDVDGVKTAKLELVPKSPKVLNMFSKIVIWVDAPRGISLKQQAFEPSGDYRLSHYTNVKVNTKISDDVFKLHTSGHVKTIKGY
ncbi:MAG TPA: outer membrane lipoprotein carrier protein LolA [Terriglobales bacterium]|nr:outer membrane lipoprotein carrier protein LolA [Terriglobales bacterium]